MHTGHKLKVNQRLTSRNGKYWFVIEDDGNLCLYKEGELLFDPQTNLKMKGPKSGWHFILQKDANCCLYDGNGDCQLSSGTDGYSSCADSDQNQRIVMQDDGNFVQYVRPSENSKRERARWCTRTEKGVLKHKIEKC